MVSLVTVGVILIVHVHSIKIEEYAGVATLELVHVVFRHGDRTPDNLYPNDRYNADSFYPVGIGQLTNQGKQTAYNIGVYLREIYCNFIPNTYTPDILEAVSSHYTRTQASLQLVLAGLFPPSPLQKWNSDLNWQPITYSYLPEREDKLFMTVTACPKYFDLMETAASKCDDPIAESFGKYLTFLKASSGFRTGNIFTIGSCLYSTLRAEEEFGLDLPDWTSKVYPDVLKNITQHSWKYYTGLGDMKILQPGFLISQILNNTLSTINRTPYFKNKKLFLYSGHDINLVGIQYFLDAFEPHNPNYGANIIIEVHKMGETRYLKFLYNNNEDGDPVIIPVPTCGIFCRIEDFISLYGNLLDRQRLESLCG